MDSRNNITTGSGNVVIGVADVSSATGDDQLSISDGEDGSVVWMTGDSSANITFAAEVAAATLDISGAIDIDGTSNLDAVDIDGAVQIDGTVTVGVDGHRIRRKIIWCISWCLCTMGSISRFTRYTRSNCSRCWFI